MRAALLFVVLLGLVSTFTQVSAQNKIVGGTVANQGQFPWMCTLLIPTSSGGVGQCGASIINGGYYGITAAHCFDSFNPLTTSTLAVTCSAGTVNNTDVFAPTYQIRQALFVRIHGLYNASNNAGHYDVALLRFAFPFIIGNGVSTIPFATSYPSAGTEVYVSGWGDTTEGGELSELLLWTALTYRSLSDCQKVFNNALISGVQVCAGGNVGHDTCQGDSGGPLFTTSNISHPTDAKLLGLTSFGIGCGGSTPGVYADVPTLGTTWVNSIIGSPACRSACYLEFRFCKIQTTGNRRCRDLKQQCFLYCKNIRA